MGAMKRPHVFRRFLRVFCFGMSVVAHAAGTSDYLIQKYRVGRVSPDMAPAEAARQYPAKRVKQWEPFPRVHVIDIDPSADPLKPSSLRIHLDAAQKEIWLITISDPRYHTSGSISIGSTFGALKKAHPNLRVGTQEGEMDRLIVAEIVGEGISCLLPYDDETWKRMKSQPNSSDVPLKIIPDSKVIQSISVIPQPPATAPESE